MVTIHGPDGRILDTCPERGAGCWIELLAPGPDELTAVAAMTGLEEPMLEHALDLHERPRIEVDEEATLLVIRAPHTEGEPGEHRYSTVPVGILLTPEAMVVVCNSLDTPLAALLHRTRSRAPGFRPEHCICGIIKDCALLFMRDLKDISARIQEVERELAASQSNEALKTLLTLQKSVTYFHAALKTNDFIIDRIIRRGLTCGARHRLAFSEEEQDVLDDALTDTRQGIYMSKIFTEVLNSITTVYSSIISNSVNQIMKLFTSITVLLMIPTLITSMYGMNIPLPLQEHPLAFSLVAGAGVALTGAVFLVMKMRRMM